MRNTIKGAVIGGLVAAFASVLLAQSWTAPRTWSTGDLLTAGQFNSNFRDNLINLRANSACSETGITGTASATTVLFGDCRWEDLPTTSVFALNTDTFTTSSTTYVAAVTTPGLDAASGQSVNVYFSGFYEIGSCDRQIYNSTTATELFVYSATASQNHINSLHVDSSPSTTSQNVYMFRMRDTPTTGLCRFRVGGVVERENIGLIAVATS